VSFGARWRPAIGLLLLAAAAYAPFVADAGWIWDDDDYVTANPVLTAPGGLVAIWTDASATPQYYPLTHTSFWIERRLFGLDPRAYRATNALLHGAATVLLWLGLRRLRVPGAWVAAALFAVHPIQVESVAWVTERKNVLCAALYLGSTLCWIRVLGLDRESSGGADVTTDRFAVGTATAGLTLYAGALLAKTVACTLPATLVALLFWKRVRPGRRHALYLGAMAACGVMLASLTATLERIQIGTEGAEWALSAADRLRIAGRAWWFYLGKIVWPADLSFVYPRWPYANWGAAAWAPLLAALALAALAVLAAARSRRGPLAALAHYTCALAPALAFVDVYPMRYSFVADHFAHLASIAPFALIAAAGATVLRRRPAVGVTTAAVALAALTVATWSRVPAFSSAEALWRDVLRRNPTAWIAHGHLGILAAERGDDAEAERRFREVLRLYPAHPGVGNNLGIVLLRAGRIAEAERVLSDATARNPEDANAWERLGDVRARLANVDGAVAAWTRAVALRPGDPSGALRIASAELARARFARARRVAETALAAAPTSAGLHHAVGLASIGLGDPARAEIELRAASALAPEDAIVRAHLGNLLASLGRIPEAAEAYRQALRIDPSNELARERLRALPPATSDGGVRSLY